MNFLRFAFIFFCIYGLQASAQHPLIKPWLPSGAPVSSFVHQVHADSKGNIWILTDQALHKIYGNRQQVITRANGLPELSRGIFEDNGGNIWIYSATGEAGRISGRKVVSASWSDELNLLVRDQLVNSFSVDKMGNGWVTTVTGGACYRILDGNIMPVTFPQEISFFIRSGENKTFAWGSLPRHEGSGKLRFYGSGQQPQEIMMSVYGAMTRSIFKPLWGNSYIFACDHEMLVMNDSMLLGRAFTEKSIESVHEDREGKLWVGLQGGGVICYPGGIQALTGAISYLSGKTVSSISEDLEGNLWFGTAGDGVYRLQAPPNLQYKEPQVFTEGGEPEEITVKSPVVALHELPATRGQIQPFDTIPPTVFMTGLRIADRDTQLADNFILPHDRNYFKFNFGATGSAGQRLQYRYRLWGHDADWIFSDQTSAIYNNLHPGEYQFVAEAMDQYGNWSNNTASISFRILAPFWESWWFRSAVIAAGLFMVVGVSFIRIRSIRKSEQEKTSYNKKIADLELQALRSQMNPHFIFNTLASIQHYINEQDTHTANHYLSRFAKLMRAILAHSRKSYISLRDELQMLQLYLELEALRCGNRFRYEISVDESVDPAEEQIPSMLLQPYVENAIWHGLLPLSREGTLKISVKSEGDNLLCLIEDDGIGRKKAAALKGDHNRVHKSMGLTITSERMSMLSRREQRPFLIKIEDCEPANPEEPGTRVELMIPTTN